VINKSNRTNRQNPAGNPSNDKKSRLGVILAVMMFRFVLNMCLISTAYAISPCPDNGRAKVSGEAFHGSVLNSTFNVSSGPNSNGYTDSTNSVSVVNISNSGLNMTANTVVGIPGNRNTYYKLERYECFGQYGEFMSILKQPEHLE